MMSRTINLTMAVLIAAMVIYQPSSLYAQSSVDAQVSLGTMKVSDEVKVILVDGSEVNLKDESYPIYPDMIIDTLEDGKATLIVNGGKYVIEPNSVFKVQSIGNGYTGLLLTPGDEGEVCYCFNPKGGYLVDTPEADTIPQSETALEAGSPQYVDGRTNYRENTASAIQFDGHSVFKTSLNETTLEPGDALSYPPSDKDSQNAFDSKYGCCKAAVAPFVIPASVGAAAVTGAVICGAACGGNDNDSNASNVLRSNE